MTLVTACQRVRVTLFFLLLAITGSFLHAQNAASGDLHGYVRDQLSAAVPNATVTVEDPLKGLTRTTRSDATGSYEFLLLPPGTYTVTVEAGTFSRLIDTGVTINIGQTAELNLDLKPATVTQQVTVSANADIIETERSSQATTVDERRITNLPINGRNYINFTLTNSQIARDAAPSVGAIPTSGLNFGGVRARSNSINVDGADAGDYVGNGARSTVSQDAVQEFQIITNGFAPEYGRAAGGVINIVTKSGSNEHHGSAYGFLRQRSLEAVNPFSTTRNPAYTRVQAGFTLGGPIIKDHTFYFFATEITRRQETGFSDIGSGNFGLVPIDASKFYGFPAGAVSVQGTPQQQAALNAIPAAQAPAFAPYVTLIGSGSSLAVTGANPAFLAGVIGPANFVTSGAPLPTSFVPLQSLIGNFPVSEKTEVYSLRLDHKLTATQQLFLRGNVSPSYITGIQENAANQNFGENSFSRTATQRVHDFDIVGQHSFLIGSSKVNELRVQYARHPVNFANSPSPGGSEVAVNIPGFAYFGKTPYTIVDRIENQAQVQDNFSYLRGPHSFKFGVDARYIPINFKQGQLYSGGDYTFGALPASAISSALAGLPGFSPVQAYGLGLPQSYAQAIGITTLSYDLKVLGAFAQDQWRVSPRLTLNYGVRYDVEGYPQQHALNAITAAAERAYGVREGIRTKLNNVAPRVGFAIDPGANGHTVVRGNFGVFYDRAPGNLEAQSLRFNSNNTPLVILGGGAPCPVTATAANISPGNLNASNTFQGTLSNPNCLPVAGFGYLPAEQRFNPDTNNSLFNNQNYLAAGFPLAILPSGLPASAHFSTPYVEQISLGVEHDLGRNYSLNVAYNFTAGRHLNRPINVNPVNPVLLTQNWERANAAVQAGTAGVLPGTPITAVSGITVNPEQVASAAGTIPCGVGPVGPYVAPALVNFFRRSGLNISLGQFLESQGAGQCVALAQQIVAADGLGVGVPVPFGDMSPNLTTGTSNYNGITLNLRKRFASHYEFLASYTFSKAIDDSTDVVSVSESAQNDFNPNADRSVSSFDQRHRFVLSGVYNTGHLNSTLGTFFRNTTVAPIIEISSGRPFNILTGQDTNFNFTPLTDRPNQVAGGTTPDNCGNVPVASRYSHTGFLNQPCYIDGNPFDGIVQGTFNGSLGRNAGVRPYVVFTDLRLSRNFALTDRVHLDVIGDGFNLLNRNNTLDVNLLYTQAGRETAAYDPRQFQFALRLSF